MVTNPEHIQNAETAGDFDRAKLGNIATEATFSLDGLADEPEEQSPKVERLPAEAEVDTLISDSKKAANLFLRRYGPQLGYFAKDSSLRFDTKLDISTFQFDAEKYSVNIPLVWFMEKDKYTEDEFSFANHHELGHFIDMRTNPDAYIHNFDYMRSKALQLARDYCHTHPDSDVKQIQVGYYRQLHALYNCLDDIYVNNLVTQRNPYFSHGKDGEKTILTLYQKLGFGNPDLRKAPLHMQLAHALLRDEMIGDTAGKSIVDERVEEVLSKKGFRGRTIRDRVAIDLKPKQGTTVDPEKRHSIIRTFIEREFLKLLEIDIEESNGQQPDNQESGNQQQSSGSGQQSGDKQSDDKQSGEQKSSNQQSGNKQSGEQPSGQESGDSPFEKYRDYETKTEVFSKTGKEKDDKSEEAIARDIKESEEHKKLPQEERAKKEIQKKLEEFDKDHNISKKDREAIEDIKSKIKEPRKAMREFWKRLIGKSIVYKNSLVKEQLKGKLDVDALIKQYPDIQEIVQQGRSGDLRRLRIYERNGLERQVVDQPEEIDVTLLIDCSGSMEGQKTENARRAAALLMYSIKDFNEELERTRKQTLSKLHANTQVITFESQGATELVKDFEKNVQSTSGSSGRVYSKHDQNEANIISSVSKISARGTTYDDEAMEYILTNLSQKDRERIKSQKLKKIVFEITDGDVMNAEATKALVKRLGAEGVIMVGFRLGSSEQPPVQFTEIWSEKNNSQGIYLGNNVSELPAKLIESLASMLEQIRI